MKVGLIGCGGMGTTHNLSLKALSGIMDIEVTALADCRPEFLERAAKLWPDAKAYSDGMELIAGENLDIVHICLPSYLHTSHALAAMEKGFHVLVEKPVCLSGEDGRALLEAEKKSGVKVMVGQVVRSFDEHRYLKAAYEDERFGKLKSIVLQRIGGDVGWGFEDWFHDEKRSGSVVLDLHVHDLDFLRYMLGEPDNYQVKAAAFESGMVNQIITSYEFGSVFATAEGTWNVCSEVPFESSFRAYFEDASVVYKSSENPGLTVYKKDGSVEHPKLNKEYDVKDNSAGINISNLGPYFTEIKYFAECVRDNKVVEVAPLIEGVKSVELALLEWKLAREYVKKNKR